MAAEEPRRRHVLVLPFPAQSHISPMMKLSKMLAANGVTISFAQVSSIHDQMMQQKWTSDPGLDIRPVSLRFPWNIPRGFDAECLANIGKFFQDAEQLLVPVVEQVANQLSEEVSPVLCIISDYFLPWTQHVADKCGIPRIIFKSGAAAWLTVEYHLPQLLAGNHIFPTEGKMLVQDDATVFIPGISPLLQVDVPELYKVDDILWEELSLRRSSSAKEASWILVNSFYELEKQTFDHLGNELGPKLVPVGPLYMQGGELESVLLRAEDKNCMKWLDLQACNSVLYISFGSFAVISQEQFQELSAALLKCKQKFLWVIRPELVTGGGSDSEEMSYNSFLEKTVEHGMIISWAPQLRVLAHASIGGFLTHCGWNSSLESICNGVPTLGWPYGAEQNMNRKLMVDDWKVGAGFFKTDKGVIQQAEIERVIKMVMESEVGKEMRKAADVIKVKAHEDGMSSSSLQRFFDYVKNLT